MFPSHIDVGCVAPRGAFSIRVTTVVFIQIFAGKVLRGPVVLVGGLLAPALTGVPRCRNGHIPSIGFTFSLQTLMCRTRWWWRCCAAGDVAELPALVEVHGEAPWAGLPIRVSAVIHFQVLVGKFGRKVSMSMWALRVPGLAVKSGYGLGNFALIVFSTTVHAFIFTLGNVTEFKSDVWVGGVAPRTMLVVVWVPAVVFLQSLGWVFFRNIFGYVRKVIAPLLAG